ncbi:hypothetical protein IFM89_023963, partial [Coptis chinensis]
MLKKGNIDGAMNLLQANYEAVKEQIAGGDNGMEQAAILDVIALGYMGVGDFEFVECLLDMLVEIVGNVKNNEPFLDSVLLHMGTMYTNFRKYEEAMAMYERSLEILEGLFGKSDPFVVPSLLGMAKVYTSIGRVSKSVEIYRRTVDILEMSRGAESLDVVVPLIGLGNLFIREGHAKLYGDHYGRVGIAMCSLANAKCAKDSPIGKPTSCAMWPKYISNSKSGQPLGLSMFRLPKAVSGAGGSLDEAVELYRKGLQVIKDSKYIAMDDEVMEKIRIELADLYHIAG